MKKFFNLVIICLLALVLVACGDSGSKDKLEVAHLSEDKLGVYYDASNATVEVKESAVVVKGQEITLYTDKDSNYVIKYGDTEAQLSVKFEGKKVTVGDFGTFALRKLGTVAEANQGVYANPTNPTTHTTTIVVREATITLENGLNYTIFADENGLYYVINGVENYITFGQLLNNETVSIGQKTFVKTGDNLPAEDGELTQLVKKVIENLKNTQMADFAYALNGSVEGKQTIVSGERKNSFDLISMFLGDLKGTITGSLVAKNLDLTDLTKLLAEAKVQVDLKIAGENQKANVQVNVQDGKVFVKQDNAVEDSDTYEVSELPASVNVDELLTEEIDLSSILSTVANLEAELAKAGVTYSDIKELLSKVFVFNEDGIKINIIKTDLYAVLAGVKLLLNTKLSLGLDVVWNEMTEEEKAEYNNSVETFKTQYKAEVDKAILEAEAALENLTIRACKLEINFKTFNVLIDIDITLRGEDTVKETGEDGEETEKVVCVYDTALKLNVSLSSAEVTDITKVNPADYVIDASTITGLISKYIGNVTLPNLSENATFSKNVDLEEDGIEFELEINHLTQEEQQAVLNAINALNNGEEYNYSVQYVKYTDEQISELYAYGYQNYNETGEVTDYRVEISIEIEANDLFKITPVVGEGLTVTFDKTSGDKVWASGYEQITLDWEDDEKVVYITVDNNLVGIVESWYKNTSLSFTSDANVQFTLGNPDEDYIPFGYSTNFNATYVGPRYAKAGDTVTAKLVMEEDWEGNVYNADIYDNEYQLIKANVASGEEFQFTLPASLADDEYSYFSLNIYKAGTVIAGEGE